MVTLRDVLENIKTTAEDSLGRWTKVEAIFDALEVVIYTVYVPQQGDLGGQSAIRRQLQQSTYRIIEIKEQDEGRNDTEGDNLFEE